LSSLAITISRYCLCYAFGSFNTISYSKLRENGWDRLFASLISFCEKHGIEILGLNDCHSTTKFGHSRLEENQVTIEHYFRVEIFYTTIDRQLQELNSRFSEQAMNLLTLSCALSPKDSYKYFNIDIICTLVEKYYPMDFSDKEKSKLQFLLRHFLFYAHRLLSLKNLSTISRIILMFGCNWTNQKLPLDF